MDTPVWIDHLHRTDPRLQRLLIADGVYLANPVVGELAAGNLPNRRRTMADLRLLPRFTDPAGDEVLDWIERRQVFGKALSWVDCVLLVIAEQNRARIYTRDRLLAREAEALRLILTR